MKNEIISNLSEILEHEDIYQAKRELKHLFDEFEKSKAEAIEEQKKIFDKELEDLSEEEKAEKHFEVQADPLDEEFEKH
jgi:isopropylmalate/homocitrate/citramalate synthase